VKEGGAADKAWESRATINDTDPRLGVILRASPEQDLVVRDRQFRGRIVSLGLVDDSGERFFLSLWLSRGVGIVRYEGIADERHEIWDFKGLQPVSD
jgi:hypothetical protein